MGADHLLPCSSSARTQSPVVEQQSQQGRLSSSMLKKVLNRKAVDLWHCGYFDCGPLDVLRHERPVDLLPWYHE